MGLCPLFGWGKTSAPSLRKSLPFPLAALVAGAAAHLALGGPVGLPAIVQDDPTFPGTLGLVIQKLDAVVPVLTMALVFFNLAVIVQEFARGVAARRRAAERRHDHENVIVALAALVSKNRRRYGGYLVHLGVISMFVGFVGTCWVIHHEASLSPGQRHRVHPAPRLTPLRSRSGGRAGGRRLDHRQHRGAGPHRRPLSRTP